MNIDNLKRLNKISYGILVLYILSLLITLFLNYIYQFIDENNIKYIIPSIFISLILFLILIFYTTQKINDFKNKEEIRKLLENTSYM